MNKRMTAACAMLIALLMLMTAAACAEGNAPAIGSMVTYGRYEQDNDKTNGQEPIEWRVLQIEDGVALLVSRYALDAQPYNETPAVASWIKSTMRTWLNDMFYNAAFTAEEKQSIVTREIVNRKEKNTADPVFLLSTDEAKRLFSSHADRQVEATAYAIAQGAYMSEKYTDKATWWCRTTSWETKTHAAYVAASGGVMTCGGKSFGRVENDVLVVRPAIYVSLEALTAAQ
ncbi:MAG: DUF6273 domain-containing protein [Candidatus Ventricola sp.]